MNNKRRRRSEDSRMLDWLIRSGYTPGKWRALYAWEHQSCAAGNGLVCVGRGGRREIRKAMNNERQAGIR